MHSGNTLSVSSWMNNLSNDHGIVYKRTRGSYEVRTGNQTIFCSLANRLRKDFTYAKSGSRKVRKVKEMDTDPIAIGDQVRYALNADGTGTITEILPRQSQLSRQSAVPMPGAWAAEQVIVANVSQVIPVFAAANPAPRWNMLDRYLVTAESMGLPSLICITKLDLVLDEDGNLDKEIEANVQEYRQIGYPVILVSSLTGEGLDELRQALRGHISVLLGKSGVGKSSLLNAIEPGLGLRVNEISRATGKGKHTTTHLEMFPVGTDSAIVDTPGVREFGLWEIENEELADYFPEMRPFLGNCKFGLDCQHNEEPGCAVRKAVMTGQISPRRYQSYMRMKEEF